MYPLYFSAALKSENGKPLELGEACLSETENAIDFNSEFVPLFKLGSVVQIVRIIGTVEYECFVGKVYLSTRKMLRIVGVAHQIMDAAHAIFDINENLSVSVALVQDSPDTFNLQKASRISSTIRYLSVESIKITAMEFIAEGQVLCFSLDTSSICLKDLFVQALRRIPLQRNAALLQCQPISPSIENRRALLAFQENLSPSAKLL